MEVIVDPILLQEPNAQLQIAVIAVCSRYIPMCKVEFIDRARKADIWQSYIVGNAKRIDVFVAEFNSSIPTFVDMLVQFCPQEVDWQYLDLEGAIHAFHTGLLSAVPIMGIP
jgi:hypothetical protein